MDEVFNMWVLEECDAEKDASSDDSKSKQCEHDNATPFSNVQEGVKMMIEKDERSLHPSQSHEFKQKMSHSCTNVISSSFCLFLSFICRKFLSFLKELFFLFLSLNLLAWHAFFLHLSDCFFIHSVIHCVFKN